MIARCDLIRPKVIASRGDLKGFVELLLGMVRGCDKNSGEDEA
jgi:hypothetical protein